MRQVDKKYNQTIELQYFGNVELYSSLIYFKNFYFYPESAYQKAHHPNRMWLSGANGLISLSIPLLGGRNQKACFKDLQIAEDGNWRRVHWRTIHDCYRKSPWFEELGCKLEAHYQRPRKFLLDWNQKSMELAFELMGIKMDILSQAMVDEKNAVFVSINSEPLIKPPETYPVYTQVFMERSGFVANLSIIDLLLCCGPATLAYLKNVASCRPIE